MPINITVDTSPVNIVGNAPTTISVNSNTVPHNIEVNTHTSNSNPVNLSNYPDNLQLNNTSGQLSSDYTKKISDLSGVSLIDGYLSNLAGPGSTSRTDLTGVSARFYLDTYNNTNTFGSSFRGRRFRGTAENPSGILKNDVILQLVGDGQSNSGTMENAAASLAFFAAEDFKSGQHGSYIRFRTTPTGGGQQLERVLITSEGNIGINNSNPKYTLDVSGAANFTSGIYINGILVQGGGGSGVTFLNSLAGSINLSSSSDDLSFANIGQSININKKPQNLIFYRNELGSITGVQKNTEFVRIYKNNNDKITGIYYNNYYKKVLLDNNDNITGVNVIYT